jgi:hypothetical protein
VSRHPKTHVLQGCSCPVSILPGYQVCTSGCSATALHPVSRDHRIVPARRNTYGRSYGTTWSQRIWGRPNYRAQRSPFGWNEQRSRSPVVLRSPPEDLPTSLREPSCALMITILCGWLGIITNVSRPTLAELFGMSAQYLKAIPPIFDGCTRLTMVLLLPASPWRPQPNSSRSTLALSPSRCSKVAARCPDQFCLRFSGEVPAAG